jgi:hypothetical protein
MVNSIPHVVETFRRKIGKGNKTFKRKIGKGSIT